MGEPSGAGQPSRGESPRQGGTLSCDHVIGAQPLGPIYTGLRSTSQQRICQLWDTWSMGVFTQLASSIIKGLARKFACKSTYACSVNGALCSCLFFAALSSRFGVCFVGMVDTRGASHLHFMLATCGNDNLIKLWDVLASSGSSSKPGLCCLLSK